MRTFALPGLFGLLICLFHAPAEAQPTRVWVSGVGNDANACSRDAPCKTFAGALGTVAAGDPGAYGTVTIDKSVTIDCLTTFAGILASGINGININTAGVVVTLRGLTIDGNGSGGIGVNFTNGSVLRIERSSISRFRGGSDGIGIHFKPPTGVAAKLYVTDTVVSDNGLPAGGGGIFIQPSGTGSAHAVLKRVRAENNTHGIQAIGTGATGSIVVQIRDSAVGQNTGNGITALTAGGPTGMVVDHTSAISNAGAGVRAEGPGALVHLGNSTVVGNGGGLLTGGGGQIFSYKNNQASGNSVDGAPTGVLTVK